MRNHPTWRKLWWMALLALGGALVGQLAGHMLAAELRTAPVWLGPLLVLSGIALVLTVAMAVLPMVLRSAGKRDDDRSGGVNR